MKRKTSTIFIALGAILMFACSTSQTNQWSKKERKTMRRALNEYREMVYINEMTDAQFFIFGDQLMDEIEINHPNYTEIIGLPYLDDTIKAYITTTIVEQLDADGSNMRYIYPYRLLKSENRVPAGLTRQQLRTFYKCLARKIDAQYSDFQSFFYAVAADTTDKSQIAQFQLGCAKSLFDWNGGE